MVHDESLDQKMTNKMLKQMEISMDDLDAEESFGFDDLSLEKFRQDLLEEYNRDKEKYKKMPKGIYSGFKSINSLCPEDGVIALLGYPAKPPKSENHEYSIFDLIYIDKKGDQVVLNQKEILDALTTHKEENRDVPRAIDKGEISAINELANAMQTWLKNQASEIDKIDGNENSSMGKETKDVLAKLRKGNKDAIKRIKENTTVQDKYQLENFDLITWLLTSK
jgi:hypothetical protein